MTEVRQALSEDIPEILRLYRQLHPKDPVLEDGSDLAVFEAIFMSEWLALFLLEDAGRVLATAYLNVVPNITRGARPYAVIENVVTDEAVRGQGYGKTLMAEVLAEAWSRGCYTALLQTGSRRPSTHAFYQACGFSPDDKTGYVARPPGT
ncbi:MAG: GNAT family N-acetyltransferase [Pseudomonadota bacterium]